MFSLSAKGTWTQDFGNLKLDKFYDRMVVELEREDQFAKDILKAWNQYVLRFIS